MNSRHLDHFQEIKDLKIIPRNHFKSSTFRSDLNLRQSINIAVLGDTSSDKIGFANNCIKNGLKDPLVPNMFKETDQKQFVV